MIKIQPAILFFQLLVSIVVHAQTVSLTQDTNSITLSNAKVSFSFNKSNADIIRLAYQDRANILGKQGRGYLLGPGFSMHPAQCKIVRQEKDLIEISFYHAASNHFQYDLHYILRGKDAGIYCFLVQTHKQGDSAGVYGQTRWGLRADESLFDYHLVRDSIQGPMPKMADLKDDVQDWTFKLNDSTYYTKYDYADYIEGRHVHGMAGTASGLGLFVIQASHEYLNGGPTKQYQNVHSTPFMICMFNCGHFLSDKRMADDKINDNWSKLDGPFFLYVNNGKNTDEVWKDAKEKAKQEMAQWPYTWMKHPEYPLDRSSVTGQLLINNMPAAKGTHIILAAPGYDWQAQTRGYIYTAQADEKGQFNIEHVRKGNYTLYAYGSNQAEEFSRSPVAVNENTVTKLGQLSWKPRSNGELLFQLGIADRTTRGFKLSNHKRNYSVFSMPPADLDFTIGKSDEGKDWYYAQTKNGSWNIHFTTTKRYTNKAVLTIAVAGAARNPQLDVYLNDEKISAVNNLGNDASVYRSAIAGGYYQLRQISFDAALLKQGDNHLSFKLHNLKPGAGIMYDAIKLEADK